MERIVTSAAAAVLLAGSLCWAAPPVQAVGPSCGGRAATIVGTGSADVIRGTARADVIVGLGGNDTIAGLAGNDWICGDDGSDRLAGGLGADHVFGGRDWVHVTDEGSTERVGDSLAGDAGDDLLVPGSDGRAADDVIPDSISWESAPRGVHVDAAAGTASGQGTDHLVSQGAWLIGSDFADVLQGGPRRDLLSGGRGPDRLLGEGGNDRILTDPASGGATADVALGGDGNDQISAAGGADLLRGGPGADIIDDLGRAAARMYGGSGADMLVTQLADTPGVTQVVDGGPGTRDLVDVHTQVINPTGRTSTATWNLATGRLVFTLDHPVTATVAHVERVDLSAWGTVWSIQGTIADDDVSASGSWGTTFDGFRGDDTFWGSAYDDTFDGGPGSDHSLGMGAGTDTCISVEVIDGGDCEIVTP
jgi:Ca2+-binding RTX toxin-like protein